MNVAIYPRVSTQEQAKEGYSIGEQTERITKYCAAMNWHVSRVYTDAGYSGASMDRPGLQALIRDVQAGKIQKVVVYKLDRLSRSQLDTLYLVEKVFIANGCEFVSITENFDTSTAFGRAIIGILSCFAQLERDCIKERLMMGADARANEGKWRGGPHPYGYDYKDGILTVNNFEAMIVRSIYRDYIAGVPINKIRENLTESGYTLRGSVFCACNVRYILSNRVYAGYIRHRGAWLPGTHEPIIDENTANTAAKMVEESRLRSKSHQLYTGHQTTYLGGILYCKRCGGRYCKCMTGAKGKRYATYVCYSRHKKVKEMVKDPNCMNTIYRVDELDNIVFDEIRKLQFDPEYFDMLRAESGRETEQDKQSALESEISRLNNQISRFMDLYGIGRFAVEQLDAKIIPLEERRARLQAELDEIQEEPRGISAEQAKTLINSFSDILDNGSFDDIRAVVTTLINRIEIDGEDITIYWNFT